jgi:ABC-type phosphate transport system substrate-binding protein
MSGLAHREDKSAVLKIALFAAVLLVTGCAASRPTAPNDPQSKYDRDLSECEREAALSSAGSKAQALDNCMRARQHAPKR